MFLLLHRWLTSRFQSELTRLEARLTSLESERLQRELETTSLLDALTKHLQRLRQRDRRIRESLKQPDSMSEQLDLDPISRLILESRQSRFPTSTRPELSQDSEEPE